MFHRIRLFLAATWLWIRREPRTRIVRGVRAMEYDPHTQWKYHLIMTWVWLISAVPILVLFFWFPGQWLRWGLLITLLYSLYANCVSDFTGLHAAWAAMRGNQIYIRDADEHDTHAHDP